MRIRHWGCEVELYFEEAGSAFKEVDDLADGDVGLGRITQRE